ncbi:hypothetical protein KK471_29625, partial [Klebsiella pneumoniae]|uniref:hypothetical protein n=1 Tax=Klebsiella pneumoniae TaxID=573 RepID=UPI001BE11639
MMPTNIASEHFSGGNRDFYCFLYMVNDLRPNGTDNSTDFKNIFFSNNYNPSTLVVPVAKKERFKVMLKWKI